MRKKILGQINANGFIGLSLGLIRCNSKANFYWKLNPLPLKWEFLVFRMEFYAWNQNVRIWFSNTRAHSKLGMDKCLIKIMDIVPKNEKRKI